MTEADQILKVRGAGKYIKYKTVYLPNK